MVAGSVMPPRLDLTNEDLVRSHVQAIWLAETGVDLGSSLRDVLDLNGDEPSLEILESIRNDIDREAFKQKAGVRAVAVLETIIDDLNDADWYSDGWLEEVLLQIDRTLDSATDRWRGLYMSALQQQKNQNKIIADASRPPRDKEQAKKLRREAEAQLDLLVQSKDLVQSDFYSYRYYASEGFLPGYNFPRLPLSAFIPGRRNSRRQNDEFLSRSRFLAISEFGPRAMVYYEGSRYIINKVILPVEPDAENQNISTTSIKLCPACSYVHRVRDKGGADLCENCGTELQRTYSGLFRLQNVSTKLRDRINCDEEERLRFGYELKTGLRYSERNGVASKRSAAITSGGEAFAGITYGHAATIWRINMGWAKRANQNKLGFVLDAERGYWAKNEQMADEDSDDPMSQRLVRVVPYVEDRKNSLLFSLPEQITSQNENTRQSLTYSLQAALKNAIQVKYQLEDNELAAEPIPDRDSPTHILFYESAEGGAGVLRRLLEDRDSLPEVAKEALRICHFLPETGEDLKHAPGSDEDCEAACYYCLMNYSNQRDHDRLDRKAIKEILENLVDSTVEPDYVAVPRATHLDKLLNQADSELEKKWLGSLEEKGLRLPDQAQQYLDKAKTKPDFVYRGSYQAVVYIDGPPHDYPQRQERDKQQEILLEDDGWIVIRFHHQDDWAKIFAKYPYIFGTL